MGLTKKQNKVLTNIRNVGKHRYNGAYLVNDQYVYTDGVTAVLFDDNVLLDGYKEDELITNELTKVMEHEWVEVDRKKTTYDGPLQRNKKGNIVDPLLKIFGKDGSVSYFKMSRIMDAQELAGNNCGMYLSKDYYLGDSALVVTPSERLRVKPTVVVLPCHKVNEEEKGNG